MFDQLRDCVSGMCVRRITVSKQGGSGPPDPLPKNPDNNSGIIHDLPQIPPEFSPTLV
jgi:hypothetical protein